MSLVFDTLTPRDQLQFASEGLSDALNAGMAAAGNWAGKLAKALPQVLQGFIPLKESLEGPKETLSQLEDLKLSRDQKKFLAIAAAVPYSDLRELRAYVPAGLSATYLELLGVLIPASEHIASVRGRVLEPYLHLLAKLVSDKHGTVSTTDHASAYKRLQAERKIFEDGLGKAFRNGERDQVTIRSVVQRNADWKDVFQGINNLTANLESIDLPGMQKQLAQCSDYLSIVCERFAQGEVSDATREAAQGLADGALEVANEMEFVTKVYFRALQLSKAVSDTVNHVNVNLG